jgi:hypothetical protein
LLKSVDGTNARWAILLDRGYIGPAEDTPSIRRVTIAKDKQLNTTADLERNLVLCEFRVAAECFFGRMWQLFPFVHRPYPFSHKYFDQDMEIIMWLTNENIRAGHPLASRDREFYLQKLKERLAEKEAREEAETKKKSEYRKRKQREWEEFNEVNAEMELLIESPGRYPNTASPYSEEY